MPNPNGFRGGTPAGQRVDMMAEISSHDGRGGGVKSQRDVPGFPQSVSSRKAFPLAGIIDAQDTRHAVPSNKPREVQEPACMVQH